jgi:sulfatase maturation enzyme AslB (radical SAM superfamily)
MAGKSIPVFETLSEMENSEWLKTMKQSFRNNEWPDECIRCKQSEEVGVESVRQSANNVHKLQTKPDYLRVDIKLDNICNLACQFCTPQSSSLIGKLMGLENPEVINADRFSQLPTDRIVEVEFSGGEPSVSKNCKYLLANLPKSVEVVRIITNGTKVVPGVVDCIDRGLNVHILLSFDGVGKVFEYNRWPLSWDKFDKSVQEYKSFGSSVYISTSTTLNALNVNDLPNIFDYLELNNLHGAISFLSTPGALDLRYTNDYTIAAKANLINHPNIRISTIAKDIATLEDNNVEIKKFIRDQDLLRNININFYLGNYHGKTI